MAGEGSKKEMEFVLTQAMRAGNSVKAQRDRLLQLQRRLQRLQAGPAAQDHDARLGVLATDLFKVYFIGLEYGARTLTTCIRFARQQGVLLSRPTMDFAVMNDEQLHDALLALAQQFPPRPTTRTQAIDRAMAALLAIKLLEEHLLPRCVECLVGGKAPVPGKPRDPCPGSVAAATEGLAKVDLSDATDTAKTGSKPRNADAARGGGGEVDKALDYMYRASRIVSVAVKHIDVAVAVLSRFLDPKKLASLTELCDDHIYISEDGPYPSSD
ncbi:hypothetical protein CFC21_026259 [Triticum aestivum]|uniref:Uncharacterized protein n=2 Tax=Triticum aestivum TaxID=4565 RepID=A0A3B6CFP4_WHEAT|nr:uncharacterized protein LOC123042602 [Triticum aestivum]KAF7012021.1 hypothetical protein CFC21_026259 [Triticum aestivum]